MIKRRWGIITALFIFLVTAFILAMRDNPNCDIKSLVLDEEQVPKGWSRDDKLWPAFLPVQDRLSAQQSYAIVMKKDDKEIRHAVYQYFNSWLAAFHLWFEREIFFPSVGWEWSVDEGVSSLSLHADQVQIKCGRSRELYLDDRCVAVFRYGPYISDFASSIEDGVMSRQEFKEVLLRIDKIFGDCEK